MTCLPDARNNTPQTQASSRGSSLRRLPHAHFQSQKKTTDLPLHSDHKPPPSLRAQTPGTSSNEGGGGWVGLGDPSHPLSRLPSGDRGRQVDCDPPRPSRTARAPRDSGSPASRSSYLFGGAPRSGRRPAPPPASAAEAAPAPAAPGSRPRPRPVARR